MSSAGAVGRAGRSSAAVAVHDSGPLLTHYTMAPSHVTACRGIMVCRRKYRAHHELPQAPTGIYALSACMRGPAAPNRARVRHGAVQTQYSGSFDAAHIGPPHVGRRLQPALTERAQRGCGTRTRNPVGRGSAPASRAGCCGAAVRARKRAGGVDSRCKSDAGL